MKKKILLVTVLAVVIFLVTGCAKEYVVPTEAIALQGETPQQVAASANEYKEANFPEEKFGKIYLNNNDELCFKLNSDQKENWYKRLSSSLFSSEVDSAQNGISITHTEDLKGVWIIVHDVDSIADIEEIEETINYYVGTIITTQLFKNEYGEPLTLEVAVYDQDDNILGVVTWPETTGYFANMD